MNGERYKFGRWGLALWLACAGPGIASAERIEKGAKAEHAAANTANTAANAATTANAASPVNEEVGPEVQSFMEKHSRRKWAAYQKLNAENRRALSGQLVNRFGELKKLSNKDLYELEVQRVEIEDELFGALSTIKRAKSGKSPAEEEQARKELRPVVERLIQNRMKFRRVRLENLQNQESTLAKEVARDEKLKEDPGRFMDMITKRAAEIERHGLGGASGPTPDARPNRRRAPAAATRPTTAAATSGAGQPDSPPAPGGTADPAE